MRSVQRGISATFLVIAVLAIAVASAYGYFAFSQDLKKKVTAINSFEECAKHYPIMESYPEQCNTPDGKHFTRQLSEEEKQRLVPPLEPSPSPGTDETANWKTYLNKKWDYKIKYPGEWEVSEADSDDVILSSKEKDAPSKANLMQLASKQIRLSVYIRQKGTLEEEATLLGTESLQCMSESPCQGKPPEELVKRSDGGIFVKSVDGYFKTLFAIDADSEKYLIVGNNYPWIAEDRKFYDQIIATFKFSE